MQITQYQNDVPLSLNLFVKKQKQQRCCVENIKFLLLKNTIYKTDFVTAMGNCAKATERSQWYQRCLEGELLPVRDGNPP